MKKAILLLAVGTGSFLCAALTPASLFKKNAVLQREMPVPVWGTAEPGEEVQVSYAGQSVSRRADSEGNWIVELAPMPGNLSGDLVIKGRSETYTLSNVVTGEVWMVGGQSNAAMPLKMDLNGDREAANARLPSLREFRVSICAADEPQSLCKGSWKVCTPKTAPDYSAMGYFFGRRIMEALDVPVGLLNCNKGGAPVFSMTSKKAFEANPHAKRVQAYIDAAVQRWETRHQKSKANTHQEPGEAPMSPYGPGGFARASVLFNGMVHPLIPYAMRGTLWNQGEADIALNAIYRDMLASMIKDWRARWGQPNLPFYVVQLANISDKWSYDPSGKCWPLMREAQALIQEVPNVWTAVSIDIGWLNDRHPKNKRELGRRLALLALAETYGKDVAAHSPFFKQAEIKGGKIICAFDAGAKGLKTSDGKAPGALEIAGEDGKFVPAEGRIEGETLVVWSPEVSQPKIARYAWSNAAEGANLVNAAGLPCSPFRTGKW